MNSGLYYVLNC